MIAKCRVDEGRNALAQMVRTSDDAARAQNGMRPRISVHETVHDLHRQSVDPLGSL